MTPLLQESLNPSVGFEADCVTIIEGPEALAALWQSNCAAVIWQRKHAQDFQVWMDHLDVDQLPEGRLILQPEAVLDAVQHLCDIVSMPRTPECSLFINDIVALSNTFCDLMKCRYLRLRLDKVSDNACSKFHKDAIIAWLVCTYRGTGTHYGIGKNGNNPKNINTVPTGSPLLMRGTLWPETPQSGFLHRSPPIEGTGETRLVLVLDKITDSDDEI